MHSDLETTYTERARAFEESREQASKGPRAHRHDDDVPGEGSIGIHVVGSCLEAFAIASMQDLTPTALHSARPRRV